MTAAYQGVLGPRVYNEHTIGLERLADILPAAKVLHQLHHKETEAYTKLPFNPDYERMLLMESEYRLLLITLRDSDGLLIGNLGYFVNYSIHNKGHLIASEDVLFIMEHARTGHLAMQMLRYGEELLRSIGVQSVTLGDKTPLGGKNLWPLMKRLGYAPIMTGYYKSLGDDE